MIRVDPCSTSPYGIAVTVDDHPPFTHVHPVVVLGVFTEIPPLVCRRLVDAVSRGTVPS